MSALKFSLAIASAEFNFSELTNNTELGHVFLLHGVHESYTSMFQDSDVFNKYNAFISGNNSVVNWTHVFGDATIPSVSTTSKCRISYASLTSFGSGLPKPTDQEKSGDAFMSTFDGIEQQADLLSESINKSLETINETSSARFSIIAQSQGALVSQKYIEKYNDGVNASVDNFISVSSPALGMDVVPDSFVDMVYFINTDAYNSDPANSVDTVKGPVTMFGKYAETIHKFLKTPVVTSAIIDFLLSYDPNLGFNDTGVRNACKAVFSSSSLNATLATYNITQQGLNWCVDTLKLTNDLWKTGNEKNAGKKLFLNLIEPLDFSSISSNKTQAKEDLVSVVYAFWNKLPHVGGFVRSIADYMYSSTNNTQTYQTRHPTKQVKSNLDRVNLVLEYTQHDNVVPSYSTMFVQRDYSQESNVTLDVPTDMANYTDLFITKPLEVRVDGDSEAIYNSKHWKTLGLTEKVKNGSAQLVQYPVYRNKNNNYHVQYTQKWSLEQHLKLILSARNEDSACLEADAFWFEQLKKPEIFSQVFPDDYVTNSRLERPRTGPGLKYIQTKTEPTPAPGSSSFATTFAFALPAILLIATQL